MHVVPISVPQLGNRCHLVHDGVSGLVVDAPRDVTAVENAAEDLGVTIVAVAETHLHNDYVSGGPLLARRHHADYLVSAEERVDVERVGVRDGDVVPVGNLRIEVLDTPGHTLHHQAFHVSGRAPRDPGRALQRRQPAPRHGRSHRPRRPAAVAAPGAGPVGVGPPARHPGCPDHAAPDPRLRQLLRRGRRGARRAARRVGAQRLVNAALRQERDAFVDGLVDGVRAGAGVLPPDGAAQPRGAGAAPPIPPRPLTAVETAAVQRVGGWVVDVRSAEDHVAGALPGSVSIPYGDQLATWVGWLVPWGAPLVLVARSVADLDAPRARPAPHRHRGHRHPRARRRPPRRQRPAPARDLGRPRRARRPGRAPTTHRRPCCSTYASATRSRPGHLRGALHIPLQDLPGRVHSLPHGELWVHCRSGYRAGIAASLIARTGRPVVHVDDDWANADTAVAPRGRAA